MLNGNATLRNVPKFVFVQACKGQARNLIDADKEYDYIALPTKEAYVIEKDCNCTCLDNNKPEGSPTQYLRLDSTFEGFSSVRLISKGSPFIHALCETLVEHGDEKYFKEIIQIAQEKANKMVHELKVIEDNV